MLCFLHVLTKISIDWFGIIYLTDCFVKNCSQVSTFPLVDQKGDGIVHYFLKVVPKNFKNLVFMGMATISLSQL